MLLSDIQKLLPHRPPFLFLDQIDFDAASKKVVGQWTPPTAWPVFDGHFPGRPMVPGVILVEMMAQAALVLGRCLEPDIENKVAFLVSIDEARFRRPVLPGSLVEAHVKFIKKRRDFWSFDADVRVAGKLAAQAQLVASVQNG